MSMSEELLFVECALAACGLTIADDENRLCFPLLRLLRRKLQVRPLPLLS